MQTIVVLVLTLLGLHFLGMGGMIIVICWLTVAVLLLGFIGSICRPTPPPSPHLKRLMDEYRRDRPWM